MMAKQRMNMPPRVALCLLTALAPSVSFADWAGGYAGLSLGQTTLAESSDENEGPSTTVEFETDPILSAFAGYQVQNGLFVFGGEVEVSRTTSANASVEGFDEEFSAELDLFDLKLRAGYDLGDTLVYGVLGFSHLSASPDEGPDTDSDGGNFGLGADYRFNDQFTIGAEYLARRITGESELGDEGSVDIDTLAICASFHF
ncbi:MAG: porin family protein [Pseudomonadota bacterium]